MILDGRLLTKNNHTETPEDFFKYNFGYDIVRDSKRSMARENPSWELPATFFEKEPGAGVYP